MWDDSSELFSRPNYVAHFLQRRLSITLRFPRFPVPRFPPLRVGAGSSSLAISTPAIWCRVFQFRVFQSRVFSAPARPLRAACGHRLTQRPARQPQSAVLRSPPSVTHKWVTTHFTVPRRVEGWVDLGTLILNATKWNTSWCKLHFSSWLAQWVVVLTWIEYVWWSLQQFIWNWVYKILFAFLQIWNFYCTMSIGLLFSGHSVVNSFRVTFVLFVFFNCFFALFLYHCGE